MWILHFSMKITDAALNYRIAQTSMSNKRRKEEAQTSYWELVNNLLRAYLTEKFIAKMDAEMPCFTQPSPMKPEDYAEQL